MEQVDRPHNGGGHPGAPGGHWFPRRSAQNLRPLAPQTRRLSRTSHLCRSETHRSCSRVVWRAITVCWNPVRVNVFARIPGNSEAAHGPGGAAAPGHSQERGIARAAARERGAAQAAHEAGALRACGPAVVRSTVLADPPAPVGAGVSGDARDAAGMAPQAGRPEVGLQQAHTQARETFDGGCGKGSGAAARQGESALGLSTNSGRAGPARTPGRLDDGLGHPYRGGHRSSPTPQQPDMSRLPDRASPRHHRLRLRPH